MTCNKRQPLFMLYWHRFEDLLRAITMARPDICEAMVFALDNAESATEVRVNDGVWLSLTCWVGARTLRSKVDEACWG